MLLPKPPEAIAALPPHSLPPTLTPSQNTTPPVTTGTSTALSSYLVTPPTTLSATGFTGSTCFPTPAAPVQNTVIVQQGDKNVYVQQQVSGVVDLLKSIRIRLSPGSCAACV